MDRLHSAAIQLLRAAREADDASPLTPGELSALSVLVFAGPRTVGQLAAAERVTAATMRRLLRDMERAGLVRRRRDLEDRRVVHIHPTVTGRRAMRRAKALRLRLLRRMLAPLTEREERRLGEVADLIAERLLSARLARSVRSRPRGA